MNGSRHEKAALTAVAYVIGFTAAYILFGNFTSTSTPAFVMPTGGNTAAVVTAVEAEPEPAVAVVEAEPAAPDFSVSYEAGKLEVSIKGEVKLLSYNPLTSGLGSADEATQGTHLGETPYVVSKDNQFIFFCEQYSEAEDVCSGYVYDLMADKIFPVTKSGVPAKISIKSASDAIFTAVGLKIGSNYSANPSAPWVMISGEDALDLQ
jgi:hypothetical protein